MRYKSFDELKASVIFQNMSEASQNCLASLALDDILPTEETLIEMQLLDNGTFTPDEFERYVIEKYKENK